MGPDLPGMIRKIQNQNSDPIATSEYGIQRDQIGNDTLNHRTIMKFDQPIFIEFEKESEEMVRASYFDSRTERSMNRDPDAYRYKWSNGARISRNIWNSPIRSRRAVFK
ncbi:hypothetical protein HAX54_034022 [Datura stramonium]|uniref:Ycf2 N-terminal domain-containing protein n=1 Tax=Datura stramonium TaxID=4076 RepID=A0ABS8VGU8_DATST|nr:hypothetical protein [Datura stramonium]